jgi:hypothetical protein
MHRFILSCLVAFGLVSTDCSAKCAQYDPYVHIQADVQVWACIASTFAAVDTQFYDWGPLYEHGGSLSGTVLSIEVQRSHVVRDRPEDRGRSAHPWQPGVLLTVFVAESAGHVCPGSLPSKLTIITREECCDTLPKRGECLVPLQKVVVVSR